MQLSASQLGTCETLEQKMLRKNRLWLVLWTRISWEVKYYQRLENAIFWTPQQLMWSCIWQWISLKISIEIMIVCAL